MKEMRNINNFYVGELYMGESFGNLLMPTVVTKKMKEQRREISDLRFSGAIDFECSFIRRYVDYDRRLSYTGFLCLFYMEDGKFICLQDGNTYDFSSRNFIKNLSPLTSLLPKVDYAMPEEITIKDSLRLFGKLIKANEKLYSKENHSIDDLYYGTLHFYKGNIEEEKRFSGLYNYSDLPRFCMLQNSKASLGGMYGYRVIEDGAELSSDYYDYSGLFIQTEDGMVFLHNNQLVQNGVLTKSHIPAEIGESHYEWIVPFEQYLEEQKIKNHSKDINIPQSLKLIK